MSRENRHRVLVVDDEESLGEMLTRLLESDGFIVETAHNGADGLRAFRAAPGHFDLVISDVLMPEMNGSEMVGEIVRIAPNVKVIFITGYTDETVNPRISEFPFEVIRKPFANGHFIQRVRDTLGR